MAKAGIRIPGSSFGELEKIIMGYAGFDNAVSLDVIAKRVGKAGTSISRNNPFLLQIGLLEGGRDKKITPLGATLGRAIEHHQTEMIKQSWRKAVSANEFLSGLLSTVRIKRGMNRDELANHILFAADLPKNNENKAGANSIVDILNAAGLIKKEEKSKKFLVESGIEEWVDSSAEGEQNTGQTTPLEVTANSDGEHGAEKRNTVEDGGESLATNGTQLASKNIPPNITINIELKIPPVEDPVIYENLFGALRKHLLEPIERPNED